MISLEDATNVPRTVVGGGIDTTGDALLAAFRLLDHDRAPARRSGRQ
ncbi:hypothetical protein [Frankia canadensis]|nr:hypothetical protein [Frankia canadensis]